MRTPRLRAADRLVGKGARPVCCTGIGPLQSLFGMPAACCFGPCSDFPEYVAGDGRDETVLMKATGSRFVAKSGAEGLMAVMVPEKGWAIVIKMDDGSEGVARPRLRHWISRGLSKG